MTPAPPPPPSFSWRREWPWLLPAWGAALLARLPFLPYARDTYFNSDGALHLLAAKHVCEGSFPTVTYGQRYIGTFESYLAAPFYRLLGPEPAAWTLGNALLFCLLAIPVYRLCHAVGGRGGAVVGSVCLGLGTMQMLENLAASHSSYHATLLWGVLAILAALPFLAAPGPRAAVPLGLVAGLGWWTNPQIATFLAPVALCLFLHGRACPLFRSGKLPEALGPPPAVWAFRAAYVALLAAVALSALLSFTGGVEGKLLGLRVSLTRPERYLVRAIGAAGLYLFLLELWLTADRRRFAATLLAFGLGFAVGYSPQLADRLAKDKQGAKAAPVGLTLGRLSANARTVFRDPGHLGYVAANFPAAEARLDALDLDRLPRPLAAATRWWTPRHPVAYRTLRAALVAALLAGLAGFLVRHRRSLLALATLSPLPATPGILLALQVPALLALCLLYPLTLESRYLQPLWIPLAALLAATVGALARLHRAAGAALGVLAVAFYLAALATNAATIAHWHRVSPPDGTDDRVLASFAERGVTRGIANYWWGFKLIFLSDERVILAPLPRVQHYQLARYARAVEQARDRVWMFDPDPRYTMDREAREAFLSSPEAERVVERWRVGPYLIYRVNR